MIGALVVLGVLVLCAGFLFFAQSSDNGPGEVGPAATAEIVPATATPGATVTPGQVTPSR